jgi:hypothetical protein
VRPRPPVRDLHADRVVGAHAWTPRPSLSPECCCVYRCTGEGTEELSGFVAPCGTAGGDWPGKATDERQQRTRRVVHLLWRLQSHAFELKFDFLNMNLTVKTKKLAVLIVKLKNLIFYFLKTLSLIL